MRKICINVIIILLVLLASDFVLPARYHDARRKEALTRARVIAPAPHPDLYSAPEAVVLPVPIGPKKLIAVAEFENKTNWAGQANLGVGMADQLITALMNTGRFIVLERESLSAVLREQDFGVSSRTTPEGGADVGKLSRAQILIQGAITEFDVRSSSDTGGVAVQGFSFSAAESRAHVAVDLRICDTTTGQIIASEACKGMAKASGGSFGYYDASRDFGFSAGGSSRTPLDYAVRDAITQAVDFIVLELQKVPWTGRIAMVKDGEIYINCGRTAGIFIGDQFSVWRPGAAITDPETGLVLGSENALIGKIEVIFVDEKFSKAILVNGTGFARNDILKFEGRKQ